MPEYERTTEINIRQTVAASTSVRVQEPIPFDGHIVQVLRHWPPGCNALVDVAVGLNTEQIFPGEGFVALDDATPIIRGLFIKAKMGANLWADIQNTDAANAHTITITVVLVGGDLARRD